MNIARHVASKGAQQKRVLIQPKPLPAPVGGLVTSQNIGAMEPGTAIVLTNWIPTRRGVRVRGGNQLFATVSAVAVESLMAYVGTTRQLFATSDGDIFDITSVADPEVPPTPDVTGQTSNYYSSVNFATSGGYFMYAVNGTDNAELYDGTNWTAITGVSSPAITGIGTDTFYQVNAYRNRLYFVEGNSLNVWYLPVDSIGGAAAVLSLSGIFTKGGFIEFTATWSSESGSANMQSYLIVMSTEGQVAVFTGSFPGGTDWSLANVYDVSKPLGRNAWFRRAGDVILLTEEGEVPLSAARSKDPGMLALDAISVKIEDTWKRASDERRSLPWEAAIWDEKDLFVVNTPVTTPGQADMTIFGSIKTTAHSLGSGWDTRCLAVHSRQLYFGCNDGTIRAAEVGGTDNGMPYTCQAAFAWDHLGIPGVTKSMKQMDAVFNTNQPFSFKLSASVDYRQSFPIAPNPTYNAPPQSVFDIGRFDVAVFDEGSESYNIRTRQQSIGKTGQVFSAELQVPINQDNTPMIELVLMNHTSATGGYAV